ncbi:MAG TPA: diacylglycerol kinase family protein [Ktedonobacteraceae bacterium]|jgi:diacylglycerol kinase (ATP)|nr:diacylglycerol kinase family protein [Ktedonobacteraceae bacterium]
MQAVLIINPASGLSTITSREMTPEETEEAILTTLRAYGIEPEVFHTTPEDTGQGLSTRAANAGVDIVIAAGGDGTIEAIARGLIGTQTALGIIPAGTMNNLARSLNIPQTIEAACAVIAKGETHAIDVGKINDRFFLEVAGVGLEAELFPLAEEIKQPGLLSTLHGAIGGLITLLTYHPAAISLSFDEHRRRSYQALQVTICNAPFYGAHLQIAPHVLMDDGLLDVVVYRNFSKREYIRHALSISQGKRLYTPKIAYRRVKSLRITSEYPMEIQADGELHGHTPAVVTILPQALRIRVPGVNAPGLHRAEQSVENAIVKRTRKIS